MKWNSVKIIPKYDEHYLVYTKSGHMHTIYYWADSWDNFIRPRPNGATITHWAKLPPPPTSDNSDHKKCSHKYVDAQGVGGGYIFKYCNICGKTKHFA